MTTGFQALSSSAWALSPPRRRGWISQAPTSCGSPSGPTHDTQFLFPSRHQGRAAPDCISQEAWRLDEPSGASRDLPTTFPRQLCGGRALRAKLRTVVLRWDRNPFLLSRCRDSDSRRPLRLTRDYASQRPLRRRDRKWRASRVSLRAERSGHGTPSMVADEVRGATRRAPSPRECSLLRAPSIWFAPDRLFAARSVRSPVSVQTGWSFSPPPAS